MYRYSYLIGNVLIARLDAFDSYLQITRSDGPNDQHIALISFFFQILASPQRQIELRVVEQHSLYDLCMLVKLPIESQALQTSEGIAVGIIAKKLKLLQFLDVHHA